MSKKESRVRSGVKKIFGSAKKAVEDTVNDLTYESRKMYVLLFGDMNSANGSGGKFKNIDLPGTSYKLRMYYSQPSPNKSERLLVGKLELWDADFDLASPYKTSPPVVASSENPIALPALIAITFPRVKLSIQKGLAPASIQVLMQMQAGPLLGKPAPIEMAPSAANRTKGTKEGNVLAMIQQYFTAMPAAMNDPVAIALNSMVKQGLKRAESDLFNTKKDLWLVEHTRREIPAAPSRSSAKASSGSDTSVAPALPPRVLAATSSSGDSNKSFSVSGQRPASEMGTSSTLAASSRGTVAGTSVPALKQQSMFYVLMREFMRAALEAAIAKQNKLRDGSALMAIGDEIGRDDRDEPVLDEEKGAIYEDSSREIKLGKFHTLENEDGEVIAGLFTKFTKKGREEARIRKTAIRGRAYYLIQSTGDTARIDDSFTVRRNLITPTGKPQWVHANFTINDASGKAVKSGKTPALISIDKRPVSSSKLGRKASAKDAVRVLIFNTSNTRMVLTGGPTARSDLIANDLLKQIIARTRAKKKEKETGTDDENWFKEAVEAAAAAKNKGDKVQIKEQIDYAPPAFSSLD